MNRRVVVTGLGMVTPLGLDAATTWAGLVSGRSGTRTITQFEPEGFPSKVAGEVKGFDPTSFMERKEARRTDRFTQFTFAAADEAVQQANYLALEDGRKAAAIIGTATNAATATNNVVTNFTEIFT